MNHSSIFLLQDKKTKLGLAPFSCYLNFFMKKEFSLKIVIVLTDIIPLYSNKTNIKVFCLHCFCRKLLKNQVRRI